MPITEEKKQTFEQFLEGMAKAGIPAEKVAKLREAYSDPEIADAAADYTATNIMMRSDYSRQTQAVRTTQQQLDQRQQILEADAAKLAEYQSQIQEWETYLKSNAVSREDYNKAQSELQLLQNREMAVKTKLNEYGITDEVFNGLGSNNANNANSFNGSQGQNMNQNQNSNQNQTPQVQGQLQPPSQPIPQNPIRNVTELQFQQGIQQAALSGAVVQGQLLDLNNEMLKLSGQPLPDMGGLIIEAVRAGTPLKDYVEGKFKFAELRQTQQEASINQRIEQRATELAAQLASGARLPGASRDMNVSPLFGVPDLSGQQNQNANGQSGNGSSIVKPGQRGEGARRATEAFNAGKYNGQRI